MPVELLAVSQHSEGGGSQQDWENKEIQRMVREVCFLKIAPPQQCEGKDNMSFHLFLFILNCKSKKNSLCFPQIILKYEFKIQLSLPSNPAP